MIIIDFQVDVPDSISVSKIYLEHVCVICYTCDFLFSVPVPKSGDLSDPNNYRPIVLVSVLSKLFTTILTERLLSWSEDEDKLIDKQFG
jgi:hypothetical protein